MGYKSVNNIQARIALATEYHEIQRERWLDEQIAYICRNQIKEPIVGEITKEEVYKRGLYIVYFESHPVGIQDEDEIYLFNNDIDGNNECNGDYTV